jgi:protein-tyrosine phosphatase
VTGSPRLPVDVLLVCTGNVCRSPAAELLLRSRLGAGAGVRVASAGVQALVGRPVDAPMSQLLMARGADPGGFAARQFEPGLLQGANVVLTMTAAQRSAVVSRVPAALRRVFTLVEFAELVTLNGSRHIPGDRPGDRLRAAVGSAPRARALRHGSAQLDDVEDPYGRSADVYARVLDRISEAVDQILGVLVPAGATPHPGRTGRDKVQLARDVSA